MTLFLRPQNPQWGLWRGGIGHCSCHIMQHCSDLMASWIMFAGSWRFSSPEPTHITSGTHTEAKFLCKRVDPHLESPLATLSSQLSRFLPFPWNMSFRLCLNTFSRLLTDCYIVMMVIPETVNLNLSTTLPFLIDRNVLKAILAHRMSSSRHCQIHMLPGDWSCCDIQVIHEGSDWRKPYICWLHHHVHG